MTNSKVSSVLEAFSTSFAVHISKFEILQTKWKNKINSVKKPRIWCSLFHVEIFVQSYESFFKIFMSFFYFFMHSILPRRKETSSLNKILHFWYDVLLSLLQFLFPSEIWHIKEKPHVIFRWLHILDRTKYGHMKAKSLIFCGLNSNPNPKLLIFWI